MTMDDDDYRPSRMPDSGPRTIAAGCIVAVVFIAFAVFTCGGGFGLWR